MAKENQDGQEKTEEPTSKRLEEARKEGQVARSKELGTVILLLSGALAIFMFGGLIADSATRLMEYNFAIPIGEVHDPNYMFKHVKGSLVLAAKLILPLLVSLFIAGALAQILVGGWNLSTKAIMPKFSKINPWSGLKRMFSKNSLVELVKAILKTSLVLSISVWILLGLKNEFLFLSHMPLPEAIAKGANMILLSFIAISSSLILVAAIDIPWQLHHHKEELRMTKQELKEEFKNTEGNPEIKSRIRRLQMEMAQRRMMQDVPDADVIITNPEHYSVALKYDEAKGGAPILLAKGVDDLAFKIREIATEHEIPIVPSPQLSRALYHTTDIGQEIPEDLYMAVAQVLAYVYHLSKGAKTNKVPDVEIPEEYQDF